MSADVRNAVEKTNLSSEGYPWVGRAIGVLKRWSLPVPVKANGDARAIQAMDEIERQMGFEVFDRTSIEALPDDQIKRGIIVSVGTAFVAPDMRAADAKGNVSSQPNSGAWSLPPTIARGLLDSRLYVNIDGPVSKASLEVVIHEFGHALGMGEHYLGFGDSRHVISPRFWSVLRTLYANEPGTPGHSVQIRE
ncbi:hypothetical protein [Pseudomonas sp. ENNP23]|uniref:hypothetical protein n=1 Tax=Pseudomonas sp. ENNP23 TaxID=1535636 RepID=UPI001112EC5C|nr:hypothetical protein [Pseudomonas sp. ENNP23]